MYKENIHKLVENLNIEICNVLTPIAAKIVYRMWFDVCIQTKIWSFYKCDSEFVYYFLRSWNDDENQNKWLNFSASKDRNVN